MNKVSALTSRITRIPSPTREDILNWCMRAWEKVSRKTIVGGFKGAGLPWMIMMSSDDPEPEPPVDPTDIDGVTEMVEEMEVLNLVTEFNGDDDDDDGDDQNDDENQDLEVDVDAAARGDGEPMDIDSE